MFVILLTYTKPLPEVEKHLDAHRTYLDRHYADGRFLCSGPRIPRTGGVIFCRAADRVAAEAQAKEDHFHPYGVAAHEIVEFSPTKTCPL